MPHARRYLAGWLLAVAAMVGYALLWLGYRHSWGWLATVDSAALRGCLAAATALPGWVGWWNGVCTVFAPVVFRLLAMIVAGVALYRRRLRAALFVLVSVEFSGLVSQGAKDLADRPRPSTALVTAASSSFPSGHALGVVVGVAALLTVGWPVWNRRARVAAGAVGALLVVMVGFGRVALNVHHPSDVLAGFALGYSYWWLCAQLLFATLGRSRAATGPAVTGR